MKINDLPELPGVYKFFDVNSKVIYVGKAINLKRRVSSYFQKSAKNPKTNELVKNIDSFDVIITKDEHSALILENELIKSYWPKFNIALKDDKNYPSIVTDPKHNFPRLEYHVGAKKPNLKYYGPYTDRSAVKAILKELQKLFLIRPCKDNQFNQSKACLLYQIKRCSAPCENYISRADYQKKYAEAVMFLAGEHKQLLHSWQISMQQYSQQQKYEQAAFYRDLIKRYHKMNGSKDNSTDMDVFALLQQSDQMYLVWLLVRDGVLKRKQEFEVYNPISESASSVLQTTVIQALTDMPTHYGLPKNILVDLPELAWSKVKIATQNNSLTKVNLNHPEAKKWLIIAQQNLQLMLRRMEINWANTIYADLELRSILGLLCPPARTECFDVSHTSGKQVYASCVVFGPDGPDKKLYRTYKVPFEDKPDDYRALSYVFQKRYTETKDIPDLIIVDGGKGQLSSVLLALSGTLCEHVPVLAISKGPARKEGTEILHTRYMQDIKLSAYNHALYSLLFIRNESHRFALRQHRKSRQKNSIKFKIENIPGIATKKRQALYNYFGGLDGLRKASFNEITNVPGINAKLAQKIIEFFRDFN